VADIWGLVEINGIPRNGATVKLWSAGAFASVPSKDTAIPSGSPIASASTSGTHGADGAYRFQSIASGEYYASVEWNGTIAYQYHLVQDGTGLGFVLAQNYANLQLAINATASGGTLFIPPGDYETSGGFVVSGKPINIQGSGRGTRLIPTASGITVLKILTPSGATTTRFQFCSVSDFSIYNRDSLSGCTLLEIDRSRRNGFYNLYLDDVSTANGGTAVNIKSSWILTFSNCLLKNVNLGMDTRTTYAGDGGPSTSIQYLGGMIEDCVTGAILSGTSMCTFRTTIEACSTVGVYAASSFRTVIDGSYWENSSPAYDVVLDACKSTRLENVNRVNLLGVGNGLVIDGLRDASDNVIDGGTSWLDIQLGPLWASESSAGNTDVQTDYFSLWKQGKLAMLGCVEAKTHVTPENLQGPNLLQNAEMYDSADGWSLGNASAVTSGLPAFATTVIASTSGVSSGSTVSASCTSPVVPDSTVGSTMFTVGCFIKIPDSTWLNWRVYLKDGSRNASKTIPDSLKTGSWEFIAAPIRTGSSPTELTLLVSGNAGFSGQVFVSRAFLCPGTVSEYPKVAEHLMPPRVHHLRVQTPAIANKLTLATSGQINPLTAGKLFVEGSGAAVTGTTGQALFTSNPDGHRITLIGSSASNTYSLVSGGSTKLDLGAAQRLLTTRSRITLEYNDFHAVWQEVEWKP
jgi:hypothetical protein